MISKVYDYPRYYEIAFSFRNIPKEVDIFEKSISKYSQISVKNILEIGCGNSPHMLEILKRNYNYSGIDLNKKMIAYSNSKAISTGKHVNLSCQNLLNFRLDKLVDFAFIALGSLYVKTTAELISHFDSLSNVLRPGGLYFMDWCVYFSPFKNAYESWTIKRDNIIVQTIYRTKIINRIDQTIEETIELKIKEHGKKRTLLEKSIRRVFFPQEFLFFINNRNDFEFIGWWNNWNLKKPLIGTEKINRPIIIIRKKTTKTKFRTVHQTRA